MAALLVGMHRANAAESLKAIEPVLQPKQAVLEKLRNLDANHAVLLGDADVIGEINDTATRYNLHKTGPRGLENRSTVRYVQKALKMLGIDTGPADGWMGELTRTGIRDFQTRIEVNPDGRMTADLLDQIRTVLKSFQV